MARFPAVGLLGPRQAGKTSLVRHLLPVGHDDPLYLDLERPADVARLRDAGAFFARYADRLIVLDEVQHMSEALFPILRGAIDRDRRPGRFLLLGSAPPRLPRDGGESLAGRIAYRELPPLTVAELPAAIDADTLWLRGGFPDSLLAPDDAASFEWREAFARTYVERELPLLGLSAAPGALLRTWRMLAHVSGATVNYEKISASLEVSSKVLKRYLAYFEQAYLVRRLGPVRADLKKRLVKSPKVYVRDAGLLHYLLGVRTQFDLAARPERGASFEGFVVEQLAATAPPGFELRFYRTGGGAEIDVVVERDGRPFSAVEIKVSSAPTLSRGYYVACADLEIERRYVVANVEEGYPMRHGVEALPLSEMGRVFVE